MRWRALFLALACTFLATAAIAQLLQSPTFPRLGSANPCATYTGPLDLVPGATVCWAFRACSRALACAKAQAIVESNADGTNQFTIHVTSSGILNQTELAQNTNNVTKVFDQTVNAQGLDVQTVTGSTRPNLSWPCLTLGATTACGGTANSGTVGWSTSPTTFTPATGVVSFAVMAQRSVIGLTAYCPLVNENTKNEISTQNAHTDRWVLDTHGGGFILNAAADASFHAAVGVINGASSVFNVDGVETTGTMTGSTIAGFMKFLNGASSDPCYVGEGIIWDNVALSSSQRTALVNNIRAFWGF